MQPLLQAWRWCRIHTPTPAPTPPAPVPGEAPSPPWKRWAEGGVGAAAEGEARPRGATPFPRRRSRKPGFWVQACPVLSSPQPPPQRVLGGQATSRHLETPTSLQWT